jgi:pimeloyl-ACP methyl ester carboxylesterase
VIAEYGSRVQRVITTPDGRLLRLEEAGDPSGKPVVYLHGTPGCGLIYGPHAADAAQQGIRLIGYDRPGYGGSTRLPGRSVADCAVDVRAIAAALDIGRLAVWGISGGGPHALACAALLPDLAVAVASLASPAPYGAPGLDYFTGMGQENVDDTRLVLADEAAALAKVATDRERVLALTPGEMARALPTLLSEVDAAAFTPEVGQWFYDGNRLALESSGDGWWDDGIAHLRPWGFDLHSIRVPVQLWHGRHDRFVPFQHGQWLASRIPSVDAHLTEEDGHLTLLQSRVGVVHAWLRDRF